MPTVTISISDEETSDLVQIAKDENIKRKKRGEKSTYKAATVATQFVRKGLREYQGKED